MFDPVSQVFEEVVCGIAELIPYTVSDSAPNTYKDLLDTYKQTGLIVVWSGAADKTVFSSPAVNYAFRAWHDFTHLVIKADFSESGEAATCKAQQEHAAIYMRARGYSDKDIKEVQTMLHIEINEQGNHFRETGEFPLDQREFTLRKLKTLGLNK